MKSSTKFRTDTFLGKISQFAHDNWTIIIYVVILSLVLIIGGLIIFYIYHQKAAKNKALILLEELDKGCEGMDKYKKLKKKIEYYLTIEQNVFKFKTEYKDRGFKYNTNLINKKLVRMLLIEIVDDINEIIENFNKKKLVSVSVIQENKKSTDLIKKEIKKYFTTESMYPDSLISLTSIQFYIQNLNLLFSSLNTNFKFTQKESIKLDEKIRKLKNIYNLWESYKNWGGLQMQSKRCSLFGGFIIIRVILFQLAEIITFYCENLDSKNKMPIKKKENDLKPDNKIFKQDINKKKNIVNEEKEIKIVDNDKKTEVYQEENNNDDIDKHDRKVIDQISMPKTFKDHENNKKNELKSNESNNGSIKDPFKKIIDSFKKDSVETDNKDGSYTEETESL